MAEPKCPECNIQGVENIVSKESSNKTKGGDAWFEIAHCDNCGHIYGVFPKHVLSHEAYSLPPLPPLPGEFGF